MNAGKSQITVIGAGAIGCTVAAWLAQRADHDVVVAVRTPFERILLETSRGAVQARPLILNDPAAGQVADWILIATKAYDAVPTKQWLATLAGPDTKIAVLQNGVEHVARFSDVLPAERILPVVVDVPAGRLAPGHVRQRRDGSMIVPAAPDGAAFAALFEHCPIDVSTTDDFTTAAWTKLASNCTGVLNALIRQPAGIAARDDVADLIRALVHECVAVGRAEGASLPDTLADEIVARYRAGPPDEVNSLAADFVAGRPIELDARNAVIVRLGARHGISTPMNALIITLLSAAIARPGIPHPRPAF